MNMKRFVFLSFVTTIGLLLVACLPKEAPTPAAKPAPAGLQTTPALPAVSPTSMSSDNAAWAKVVEAAKKEGKITLYTASLSGDAGTGVAKAFERKYGIKLEFVTGVGATLIERIKSEQRAEKFIADTFDTLVSSVAMAKNEGLTVSIGDIPILREKDVWALAKPSADAEGHIIGVRPDTPLVWINTTVVKTAEEPRSYRELLEPRWGGRKIALESPLTSGTASLIYVATRKAGTLDDDYWRRLGRQEIRVEPSFREPFAALARGEIAVNLAASDKVAASFVKEGVPLKGLAMAEGVSVNLYGNSIALIKNTPHPNAARVLVNWLLSQEGQQVQAEVIGGFTPMRKDVSDIRPTATKVDMKKTLVLDYPMVLEATQIQREGTLSKLMGLAR